MSNSKIDHKGYVRVLADRGAYTLLDPRKVSDISIVGEVPAEPAELGTLIHTTYAYLYDDDEAFPEVMRHDVYVPADRGFGFADEVAQALAERGEPGWVDILAPSEGAACQ